MKQAQKTTILFALLAIAMTLFSSCKNRMEQSENRSTFEVKGEITNGANRRIGIYHIGADKMEKMAESTLDATGNYRFNIPSPKHFDFYLLSIEDSSAVVFIADSTETITINSNANDFIAEHSIDGNSENRQIKEITLLRAALEKQVRTMANSKSPAVVKTEREIRALIEEFKQNIMHQYIISAPGSASAYYALTLVVGGIPIFNPLQNREDSKCFAAVATNFQHKHPGTSHTKHLTEIAEKGLAATRPKKEIDIDIEESEALTTGTFDIKLPRPDGDSISLSSLAGKVVLLDFTLYENAEMGSRNIALRNIYNKYKNRNFEIYQVSFDKHEHFWEQSAANLPWTCVRDAKGTSALRFNVQSLPTFYLISKRGEVVLRDNQVTELEKEIEKLLK